MILQHVRWFYPILLLASACSSPGGDATDSAGATADTGIGPGIVTDASVSSSSSSSSAGSEGVEGGEDSVTAGESNSGGPPCVRDDECEPAYICIDNACQYDANWCGKPEIPAIIRPQVVLVLDKSGSMVLNDWDHDADPASAAVTRWNSLYSVVELITGGFDAQMDLGAVLFPGVDAKSSYAEACLMSDAPDVAVGPLHGASILAALPAAEADEAIVQGGTPATAGVALAVSHLVGLEAGPKRYLLLVTDGAANCKADAASNHEIGDVYDQALAPTVAAAYTEHEIATFVVGVDIQDLTSPEKPDGQPDGTNTYQRLNEVATAGGMPRPGDEKFYNAQNQIELSAALTAIAQQVSCTIALDPVPTDEQDVVLKIDGGLVAQDQSCDGGVGWRFVDPLVRDAIELCADTCAAYQTIAAAPGAIAISYNCKTPG
ncbi:MAG: VWA domain-containing protein [Nannocystis sp.]|nr:vWA domain-containing protein [Nannocystis sp.]MBA3547959.1 VWA domain-containing protein [Nannocystis sp.]